MTQRLPQLLNVIDGESLTSYLARLCAVTRRTPHQLLRDQHTTLTCSLRQTTLPAEVQTYLGARLALGQDGLSRMLRSYYAPVFAPPKEGNSSPRESWLALGTAGVCPACLAETGAWQIAWQVGWTFACARHHTYLLRTCPTCDGALDEGAFFTRWTRAATLSPPTFCITRDGTCTDLRNICSEQAPPAVTTVQHNVHGVLETSLNRDDPVAALAARERLQLMRTAYVALRTLIRLPTELVVRGPAKTLLNTELLDLDLTPADEWSYQEIDDPALTRPSHIAARPQTMANMTSWALQVTAGTEEQRSQRLQALLHVSHGWRFRADRYSLSRHLPGGAQDPLLPVVRSHLRNARQLVSADEAPTYGPQHVPQRLWGDEIPALLHISDGAVTPRALALFGSLFLHQAATGLTRKQGAAYLGQPDPSQLVRRLKQKLNARQLDALIAALGTLSRVHHQRHPLIDYNRRRSVLSRFERCPAHLVRSVGAHPEDPQPSLDRQRVGACWVWVQLTVGDAALWPHWPGSSSAPDLRWIAGAPEPAQRRLLQWGLAQLR